MIHASLLVLIAPREGGNATLVFAIQMVAIFAIFYFLLIRPQRQAQKRHVQMLSELKRGDEIVTAGWRVGSLTSLYPKGIQIGRVTSVGRTDTDLYTQVQVEPFADLSSLQAVLVLVPGDRGAG